MERRERSSGRRGRDDERTARDDERGWREPEIGREARMSERDPMDYRREGGRRSLADRRGEYPEPQHGAEWGEPGAWHEGYGGGARFGDDRRSNERDDRRRDPRGHFRDARGGDWRDDRRGDRRDDRRGDWRDDRGGEMAGFGHRRMVDMEPDWDVDRYDRAATGGLEGESYGRERPRTSGRERPSHRGRGPKDYRRSDPRIREDVCDALTEHPDIDARECMITVENGEVTLRGTVSSRRVKHMIEDLACEQSGVKDVHNEIRVRREGEDVMGGQDYASTGDEGAPRH